MKKLSVLLLVCLLLLGSVVSVNSEGEITSWKLSAAEEAFIEKYNIDKSELSALNKDDLASIIRQATAYDFTETQVSALIEAKKTAGINSSGYEGVLSEDGSYYTYGNGYVLPKREISVINGSRARTSDTETWMWNGEYYDCIKPDDKTGVYWAVKSNSGYAEATAFVKLPSVSNVHAQDRPYMFLAANSSEEGNSLTFAGDYGVVYMPGEGWSPFINASQWSDTTRKYEEVLNRVFDPIPSDVTDVYLHIELQNGATTDKILFSCMNGKDFSEIYLNEQAIVFDGNPVQANESNLNLYHETTMAQHEEGYVNGNVNTNSGTRMIGAEFYDAYLYKPTQGQFFLWDETVTEKAYRQAPVSYMLNTVYPTPISKWHNDTVNIIFNVPVN